MNLDVSAIWPVEPFSGHKRVIAGTEITFRRLPIRARFALGLEFSETFKNFSLSLEGLRDPAFMAMIDRLVELSDADEDFFDQDPSLQIPVALSSAEYNFDGLFQHTERLYLAQAKHAAVVKALKTDPKNESRAIGPTVEKEWFLFRPVMQDVCTYAEMFLDERFTFADIHLMHEMLDVRQYGEILANHIED